MRNKSILEYIILALFIMCMILALSAAIEYTTRATEREFFNQGIWMLCCAGITVALYVFVRFTARIKMKLGEGGKNAIYWSFLVVCMAGGAAARFLVISGIQLEPASDFQTYYNIAKHMLNDTFFSPEGDLYRRYIALYPHTIGFPMLVLLPVFRSFGISVTNALVANALCGIVAIFLAACVGKQVGGRLCGMICAFALAFWPSHVLYSSMIASEQSFTMMLLLSTYLITRVLDRSENSLYEKKPERALLLLILIGVTLGIAGAIRPMAMILLAAFAVVLLFQYGPEAGKKKDGVQYLLSRGLPSFVFVLIPYLLTGWIVSQSISTIILEKPAGGLTASGYNLMVGLNTESKGLWNQEDSDFFTDAYEREGSAQKAHTECMDKAIERFISAPENVLDLLVYKFRDLWQTDDFGIDWNLLWAGQQGKLTTQVQGGLERMRIPGRAVYLLALFYSLAYALSQWKKRGPVQPFGMLCVLFFLGTALAHMLLETQVRYHYNMIPYLIFMASMLISGWSKEKEEEEKLEDAQRERAFQSHIETHEQEQGDNLRFDLLSALQQGHIKMSVSEAVVKQRSLEEKKEE